MASDLVILGLGVTASVITKNGDSSLSLVNQASGTNGALTVSSAIAASYAESPRLYRHAGNRRGTQPTAEHSALLMRAMCWAEMLSFTVGGGAQTMITMADVQTAEGGTTLDDLAQYIHSNSASLGVDAATVTNTDGTESLSLTSNTAGSAGAIALTSSLYDTSQTTSATLPYTSSSDINSLTTPRRQREQRWNARLQRQYA